MENTIKYRSFQQRVFQELQKNDDVKLNTDVDKIECWGWEVNYENELIYISPMVRSLTGYESHELLFHCPYEFLSDEEALLLKDFIKDFKISNKRFFSFKCSLKKKDDIFIPIEIMGLGIYDGNGSLCGCEGVVIAAKEEISKIKR
jgi:PAS domain-containing protein